MTSRATLVSRLLDAADALLKKRPGSAAFRRRAVSTAYYALFHALAKLCADALLPESNQRGLEYARVYRALDHASIKKAFSAEPLKDHAKLQTIGVLFVELQSSRYQADYYPPDDRLFPSAKVEDLIEKAQQAISELERLSEDERRTLATCLLFRQRAA